MPDPSKELFLGKVYDTQQGKLTDQPVYYDPADLTTHAIVTGMTGSGKTGLCVAMLEEAALQNVPAIIIDPKGDLTNLLLHFPDLAPASFQPWLDPELLRREGKTPEQIAEETAASWRKGLSDWGIDQSRIEQLARSVQFGLYTPGSDAGLPVSIMSSFQAPEIPWEGNREILREKISATVTAILSLVGMSEIDPVRSREHILLSNIFENAWSQGKDLDLAELILQTQNPPFTKLGVFPLDSFFPPKDRMSLAMLLNNFLASPSFQTWLEGQPLEIASFLYAPTGQARHSIFYLAHLSDTERMFFITLLFSSIETWMRTQPGTGTLRAILYFDEIMGYMPPVANPPSKTIMLRMLKQARAFGVGLLLATQNPVDVDYKGLANAGSWFIGTLQTDQDKQRLLDGLESAGGGINRGEYDKLISGLRKRVFLMRNVHEKAPIIFQTRFVMNYLAGPLTRAQIPALLKLAGTAPELPPAPVPAASITPQPAPSAAPAPRPPIISESPLGDTSTTRPPVPGMVAEYFFPVHYRLADAAREANIALPVDYEDLGLLYRPAILAQATIRYLQRRYNLDVEQHKTALVSQPDRRGITRWENFPYPAVQLNRLERQPEPGARFAGLDGPLADGKLLTAMQRDFTDWAYRTGEIRIRAHESLKVYAGPEVSTAEFREKCAEAARTARDAEAAKVELAYERKAAVLKDKLAREQRELAMDEDELSQRKMEEYGTHAENIIGMFTKSRRRVTTSLTKRRLTEQAKADVEESKKAIAAMQAELAALEKQKAAELQAIGDRWAKIVNDATEIPVAPLKKDVYLDLFGVAWLPYHVIRSGGRTVELPAFGREG